MITIFLEKYHLSINDLVHFHIQAMFCRLLWLSIMGDDLPIHFGNIACHGNLVPISGPPSHSLLWSCTNLPQCENIHTLTLPVLETLKTRFDTSNAISINNRGSCVLSCTKGILAWCSAKLRIRGNQQLA